MFARVSATTVGMASDDVSAPRLGIRSLALPMSAIFGRISFMTAFISSSTCLKSESRVPSSTFSVSRPRRNAASTGCRRSVAIQSDCSSSCAAASVTCAS
jgi:hypothetical protein